MLTLVLTSPSQTLCKTNRRSETQPSTVRHSHDPKSGPSEHHQDLTVSRALGYLSMLEDAWKLSAVWCYCELSAVLFLLCRDIVIVNVDVELCSSIYSFSSYSSLLAEMSSVSYHCDRIMTDIYYLREIRALRGRRVHKLCGVWHSSRTRKSGSLRHSKSSLCSAPFGRRRCRPDLRILHSIIPRPRESEEVQSTKWYIIYRRSIGGRCGKVSYSAWLVDVTRFCFH